MTPASMEYNYRNLILWQKAQELALNVIRLTSSLPRDRAAEVISRQLISSACSIAANVAEGHGRFSLAAHRNHLSIAKGSACETDGWLDLLRKAHYIADQQEGKLHADCLEIIRMLTAKMRQLEERKGTDTLRDQEELYEASDLA